MDNHFLPPTLQFSGIRCRRASRWNHAQGNYIHRTARICSTSPTHCPEAQHPADFWTPVWFRSSSIRYPLRMQKGRNLWFLKSSGFADLFVIFNMQGLHNSKTASENKKAPDRWFYETNNPAFEFLWYLFLRNLEKLIRNPRQWRDKMAQNPVRVVQVSSVAWKRRVSSMEK